MGWSHRARACLASRSRAAGRSVFISSRSQRILAMAFRVVIVILERSNASTIFDHVTSFSSSLRSLWLCTLRGPLRSSFAFSLSLFQNRTMTPYFCVRRKRQCESPLHQGVRKSLGVEAEVRDAVAEHQLSVGTPVRGHIEEPNVVFENNSSQLTDSGGPARALLTERGLDELPHDV